MKTLFRSFAGGEITPEMYGRLDQAKFQTGLEKCLNFEIRPHGPAANRAGFGMIAPAKHSDKESVLIPFIYSTTQAYALEFGDLYVRFHTNAGTVLTTSVNITAITKANPGVVTYTGTDPANGDWVYLSSIGGMIELNGRYVKVANVDTGANTFELTDVHGTNINTTDYTTYTSGGTAAKVYEIVSPYAEADLKILNITQSADVLTITHPGYQTRELRRSGATSWAFTSVTSAPTQAAATGVTITPSGAGGVSYTYAVTAVASDGREESLKATATNAACLALTGAGVYNDITWTDASGAIRYNVYRRINGIYGYIGQSSDGVTGFRDDNITPDVSQTPPETDDPITSADNRPRAVGYFQGRRWFAGSNNKPQNVWATRSGTESNFTYSIPTRDSDAITARLTSRRANTILHLVPLGDLLALTSGAEWLINNGGSSGPITPDNIDYREQGGTGASTVRPVVTNNSVLYVQSSGTRVREIEFSWQSQGYKTDDKSLMATHLFDGYTLVSMAFSRSPYPTCWCVRSDGKLLGMTYVPEHEVEAWHQHDTSNGYFESIVAIPEGTEDVLYAIVRRTIGGQTRRFIERKASRRFATLADSFVVDCGLQYNGTAATTIRGLWHLAGETVSILADGAVLPQQVVSAEGTITLPVAASKVSVGLPITADLKTLPLAVEREAFGFGAKKNVNGVVLVVRESSGIFSGPSFTQLKEAKLRTTEPYGSPPAWRSGSVPIMHTPVWSDEGPVCVRQSDPLPLMLVALVPDASFSD